ncbi:MAG: hypothetical protein AAFR36_31305, partial [Bacteroidota bacterium]
MMRSPATPAVIQAAHEAIDAKDVPEIQRLMLLHSFPRVVYQQLWFARLSISTKIPRITGILHRFVTVPTGTLEQWMSHEMDAVTDLCVSYALNSAVDVKEFPPCRYWYVGKWLCAWNQGRYKNRYVSTEKTERFACSFFLIIVCYSPQYATQLATLSDTTPPYIHAELTIYLMQQGVEPQFVYPWARLLRQAQDLGPRPLYLQQVYLQYLLYSDLQLDALDFCNSCNSQHLHATVVKDGMLYNRLWRCCDGPIDEWKDGLETVMCILKEVHMRLIEKEAAQVLGAAHQSLLQRVVQQTAMALLHRHRPDECVALMHQHFEVTIPLPHRKNVLDVVNGPVEGVADLDLDFYGRPNLCPLFAQVVEELLDEEEEMEEEEVADDPMDVEEVNEVIDDTPEAPRQDGYLGEQSQENTEDDDEEEEEEEDETARVLQHRPVLPEPPVVPPVDPAASRVESAYDAEESQGNLDVDRKRSRSELERGYWAGASQEIHTEDESEVEGVLDATTVAPVVDAPEAQVPPVEPASLRMDHDYDAEQSQVGDDEEDLPQPPPAKRRRVVEVGYEASESQGHTEDDTEEESVQAHSAPAPALQSDIGDPVPAATAAPSLSDMSQADELTHPEEEEEEDDDDDDDDDELPLPTVTMDQEPRRLDPMP